MNKKAVALFHASGGKQSFFFHMFQHPGDQDHWLAICVGGMLAILTVILMVTLYRKWRKHESGNFSSV